MASACEMASAEIPKKNDSISLFQHSKVIIKIKNYTNICIGNFTNEPFAKAVIMKDWKLIRTGMDNQRLELYDLSKDIHEDENLEKVHPAILQRMLSYMEEAHEPHPNWPTPRQKK